MDVAIVGQGKSTTVVYITCPNDVYGDPTPQGTRIKSLWETTKWRYPHRPHQGEQEMARRRRQIERGIISAA